MTTDILRNLCYVERTDRERVMRITPELHDELVETIRQIVRDELKEAGE